MFSQQIQNGVNFLNEIRPGWFHHINVDRLNIGSCVDCVCGQLFGTKAVMTDGVLADTGYGWARSEWGMDRMLECGFTAYHTMEEDIDRTLYPQSQYETGYDILTEEWKNVILGLQLQYSIVAGKDKCKLEWLGLLPTKSNVKEPTVAV